MNILIGFEESQEVTKAMRNKGHRAFSCDLQDCSGGHPEWHYKADIYEILHKEKWDMLIMHPPCTKLSVSGNGTYGVNKERHHERIEAIKYTEKLWNDCIQLSDYVCFENPVGVLTTMTSMPNPQYIQPWMFGHPESKKTALFLHGLPQLIPTEIPEYTRYRCKCGHVFDVDLGKYGCPNCEAEYGAAKPLWDNQTRSGQNKLGPSPTRAKERSKTYPGIAKAMAEQWNF